MSSQNENETIIETPPLIEYLKEEIPLKEIRDVSSPKRINSIDLVKGLAILLIMICHCGSVWLDEEWFFLYGIIYTCLDMVGPSLFVFLSALSVVFSVKRKQGKLPNNIIRIRIYSRGSMIIIIGLLINLITPVVPGYPFPLNIWGWSILVFIGFSQIFSYHALKLKKYLRAIIGIIIISISEIIIEFLYLSKDLNLGTWILHYIISSPYPILPLLPWLSICFISTLFGEILYDTMEKGTKEAYKHLFHIFLFWGIVLIVFGVITGIEVKPPGSVIIEEYPHFELLEISNRQKYNYYAGMYGFFIRGMFANMWFNLGADLFIIAIGFYIIDIKLVKNLFTDMLIYYGKVSLSLFLVHYIFLLLYMGQFNIVFFVFIVLSYLGFMGVSMYIWMEYFYGIASPEWLMIQLGRIGHKTEEKTIKGMKKTEEYVVKEAKLITLKTKEGFKKTEGYMKKEGKIIADKTKETFKKLKKTKEESK